MTIWMTESQETQGVSSQWACHVLTLRGGGLELVARQLTPAHGVEVR